MLQPLSYIEISKENILHNISVFRTLLGNDKKISAVVKANAYGHGLKEIVSLIANHVDYFQVDDFQELKELRKYSGKPALVLGYILAEELEQVIDLECIIAIWDMERLSIINQIGERKNKKIKVHLEVDAFLGRLGILPSEAKDFIHEAKSFSFIEIESLYSHFSDIEDSENLDHAKRQYMELKKVSEECGVSYHISATSGILSDPTLNWGGAILRLGIGLYGLWSSSGQKKEWDQKIILKPVLSWKTKIAQVKTLPPDYPIGYGRSFITKKETKIAVIPQGYSDGYDRGFSNNGEVLISGTRCRILGRIAMNMFVVDVTHIENVRAEDEVVLIGCQQDECITAEELAGRISTINYEIVARISPLIERKIV